VGYFAWNQRLTTDVAVSCTERLYAVLRTRCLCCQLSCPIGGDPYRPWVRLLLAAMHALVSATDSTPAVAGAVWGGRVIQTAVLMTRRARHLPATASQ
jgi:hypothetical protein